MKIGTISTIVIAMQAHLSSCSTFEFDSGQLRAFRSLAHVYSNEVKVVGLSCLNDSKQKGKLAIKLTVRIEQEVPKISSIKFVQSDLADPMKVSICEQKVLNSPNLSPEKIVSAVRKMGGILSDLDNTMFIEAELYPEIKGEYKLKDRNLSRSFSGTLNFWDL